MPDRLVGPVATTVTGVVCAGGFALALVLLLGGGSPSTAPGIAASPVVAWALVMLPYAVNVVAVVTVGFALAAHQLAAGIPAAADGPSADQPHRTSSLVTEVAAVAWAVLSLLAVLLHGVQLTAMGEISAWFDSAQTQALLVQAALAAAAGFAVRRQPSLALGLALGALLPSLLTGHARTADAPLLAGAEIVTHVVAATLWIGGLTAMAWLALRHRDSWTGALPRYSRLAGWCVIALVVSGVLAALGRIDSWAQLFGSGYGVVVLLKAATLAGLVAFGAMQRRHVVTRGGHARIADVLLLTGSELVVMALVLALATGLAQTPPPT